MKAPHAPLFTEGDAQRCADSGRPLHPEVRGTMTGLLLIPAGAVRGPSSLQPAYLPAVLAEQNWPSREEPGSGGLWEHLAGPTASELQWDGSRGSWREGSGQWPRWKWVGDWGAPALLSGCFTSAGRGQRPATQDSTGGVVSQMCRPIPLSGPGWKSPLPRTSASLSLTGSHLAPPRTPGPLAGL